MARLPGGAKITSLLEHHPKLGRIVENIGWLSFDNFFRMGVGLVVGAWVARYLGPESFGTLNFVRAMMAILGPIALLGLPNIVLRELVNAPEKREEIIGTAFLLHLVGGLLAWVLLLALIGWQRSLGSEGWIISIILGSILVFKSTHVVKQVFEAQVQSKYVVWLENGIVPLVAASKITLILLEASLVAFAGVFAAEALLVGIGLLLLYHKKVAPLIWRFTASRAKSLLLDSWPVIIGGFAIVVYMGIDKVMLGEMMDDTSVGLYSAAVMISTLIYFIPTVISKSIFPALAKARKHSIPLYHERMQKMLSLMVLIAVGISLPMTFLSGPVISLIFGSDFESSGTVLAIHIWASIFVFLGVAGGKYILLENLLRKALVFTIIGALVNVVMNYYLIPLYGIIGCAIATVLSQSISAFLCNSIYSQTRPLFLMKLKALALQGLL